MTYVPPILRIIRFTVKFFFLYYKLSSFVWTGEKPLWSPDVLLFRQSVVFNSIE